MTRPRVEGIGRRVGRQVSGASGNTYTPTRDSRIMIEDSGFELLTKGLAGVNDSITALKTIENAEYDDELKKTREQVNLEEQKRRRKATTMSQVGRDKTIDDFASYLNENPEARDIPPEELMANNDAIKDIFSAHINEQNIPYEDLRFAAQEEAKATLTSAYSKRRDQKIKEKNLFQARDYLKTQTARYMEADDSAWEGLLNIAGEDFDLTDDEVSHVLLSVQQELVESSTTADAFIAERMASGIGSVLGQQKAQEFLNKNKALLERRNKDEKADLQFNFIPQVISQGKDIKKLYESEGFIGKKLKAHFTPSEIETIERGFLKQKAEEADYSLALSAWENGLITTYNSPTGKFSFTSEQDMVKLEQLAIEQIYKKDSRYLQAEDSEKPQVLAQLQIEGARKNNTVPVLMKKQVTNALRTIDEPVQSVEDLPVGFRNAFGTALKLEQNGMLGAALGDNRDSLAFRAITYLVNTGEDLLGAINQVAIAQKDNPAAFSTDYRANDAMGETLRNELSSYFSGKDDFKAIPNASRIAGKIYNVKRSFGMPTEMAKEATLKQISDDFYAVEGGLLNKKALHGLNSDQVEKAVSRKLDSFSESNPHIKREDIYVTEFGHGYYGITDDSGVLLRSGSGYSLFSSKEVKELSTDIAQEQEDQAAQDTINQIAFNQQRRNDAERRERTRQKR